MHAASKRRTVSLDGDDGDRGHRGARGITPRRRLVIVGPSNGRMNREHHAAPSRARPGELVVLVFRNAEVKQFQGKARRKYIVQSTRRGRGLDQTP